MTKLVKRKILKSAVLAVLLSVLLLGGLSVSQLRVSATTKTPLRLYSIDFKVSDMVDTYGVVGQNYPIELWQEGNANKIALSLQYNYEPSGKMYLAPAVGSVMTFEYEYSALQSWRFTFKGREYAAAEVRVLFHYVPDTAEGEAAKTSDTVVDLPPVNILDPDGYPLYYTDDGYLLVDKNDSVQLYYDRANDTSNLLRVEKIDNPSTSVAQTSIKMCGVSVMPLADVTLSGVTYQIIHGNGEPLSIDEKTRRIKPGYDVESVAITDDLFALPAKDGGAPILAKREVRSNGKWDITNHLTEHYTNSLHWGQWLISFGKHKWDKDDVKQTTWNDIVYLDLWGHEIDSSLYASLVEAHGMVISHNVLKPVMTMADYLDELIQNGNPFLVDGGAMTVIGEQLFDGLGNPVSKLHGQLVDLAGYPLLAWVDDPKDGTTDLVPRPCYFDTNGYYDYNGNPLLIVENEGKKYLVNSIDNMALHSVISELKEGKELYFTYLGDGVTMIPSFGDYDANDNKVKFSDIDGNPIDDLIVKPTVNMASYFQKNPDDKPLTGWDKVVNTFWQVVSYIIIFAVIVFALVLVYLVVLGIVKFVNARRSA